MLVGMSEYSIYWLVRPAERAKLPKSIGKDRILPCKGGKWSIVVTDASLQKKTDVAIDFCNSEWSSWRFAIHAKGKQLLSGLFGENDEAGVSAEDNFLKGDVAAAAKVLGVDAARLREVLEADEPDVQAFADLVGFDIKYTSPAEFE